MTIRNGNTLQNALYKKYSLSRMRIIHVLYFICFFFISFEILLNHFMRVNIVGPFKCNIFLNIN